MSQSNNNVLIPISILFAGAMIAVAVIFVGTNGSQLAGQSANQASGAGIPSGGAAGGDRQLWNNVGIHITYAEELGLDADALAECFESGRYTERVMVSTREGQANGGTGTPYFLINDIPVSGAVPFSDFAQVINAASAGSTGEEIETSFELEDWPSLGDPNAPVLMVEYSDFACPFCKRFAEQTKPSIISEFIDAGLVYFVRKDFIAVGGQKAAEAAHCAGEQGAYWEYHDILVQRQ